MKLLTYDTGTGPRCGVLQDDTVVDVTALIGSEQTLRDVQALLELQDSPVDRVRDALERNIAPPGLPEDYEERVVRYVPDIRYDKILEAFGGHTEYVTDPDELHSALERAYEATRQGKVACVNVISEPMEMMVSRSTRASALMGY